MKQATIQGSLRAGSGQLQATGTMQMAQLSNWSADVKLVGEHLLVMDTYEVQAWVSPDLQISANSKTVRMGGSVKIPELTISLRELPTTASTRSDDVVIVGRRAKSAQYRNSTVGAILKGKGNPNLTVEDHSIEIIPDVWVSLGEQARFNGFGLDAGLTGQVHILKTRQDIVGEGSLALAKGVYKAYGQSLQITQGRLIFNGPLDNPGVDLRAIRKVNNDNIEVGIAVNGTVRHPESTLFSSPTQTQSDTLSYLLTGRAVSTISGSESDILRQAITGLGIAGGDSIANQMGLALGLDEVGINPRNNDYRQSELSLGKRLGPRLYVKYIVGLFDSLQRVAINYQVNSKVQIEAQSGEKQGADIIYKLDTDRGLFGR